MKNILITGGAGFIGSHLVDALIKNTQNSITCLDNFDSYYSPEIKKRNIKAHIKKSNYTLVDVDIRNLRQMKAGLARHYDVIIHLAAKVGVKPSLQDPVLYTEVNVSGTQNMLELARQVKCKKFIFASSSSVYGNNVNIPWSEDENKLFPISPYASTKISGELLGHVYSHLYHFQFLSLRFFTVYGPRMRPDLAIHKFAKLLAEGKPVPLYGDGKTKRDYTYVTDIVSGIMSALSYSRSPYEIINLGNNKPVELRQLITLLEEVLGTKARIRRLPSEPGDAMFTCADISKAQKLLRYQPKTDIVAGLKKFATWFRSETLKK